MNNYCRLPDAKAGMGKRLAETADDDLLLTLIPSVSRAFDSPRVLNRQVFEETGTWYLDGEGGAELVLPFDIASISALTVDEDGDGTHELTLVANTDYWLTPFNRANKRGILLNSAGQRSAWVERPHAVKIVGRIGYRNTSEATGQTVQNATNISASATSLQVTSSTGLAKGDLLIIESEEVYVSAIPDSTHATIERAKNGTTAAIHLNGLAISRRRYPEDIELACRLQVSRLFNEMRTGQAAANADPVAGGFTFSSMYPQIRDLLSGHRHVVVY